jgi:hypothetical protein
MKLLIHKSLVRFFVVWCLLAVLPFAKGLNLKNRSITITITRIPPRGAGPDAMETIAGGVGGVDVTKCKVVVFARTNTWYVQPYAASPYTTIGDDGKWETKVHLGDEYAVLLVETSYKPPATTDTLPKVTGPVLAVARVSARTKSSKGNPEASSEAKPSSEKGPMSAGQGRSSETKPATARTIQFSGHTWRVKSSSAPAGPGPNYFSDSSDNVSVDADGRLHLRITKRDGRWYCAEIISTRSFGYGTYRFHVASVDYMDPQIVLGMFTWSDDPAYSHREIDVEISRWGDAHNKNAQFVVQPYVNPKNIVRFQVSRGLDRTTHLFDWRESSVFFQSAKGSEPHSRDLGTTIEQHTFQSGIPKAGGENARINFWLINGLGPQDLKTAEIIVDRFEFSPHESSRNKGWSGQRFE